MKDKKFRVICCPHCKAEYLPAEIFLPDEFFGKPQNILKNAFGKIEDFTGNSLNVKEKYNCDYCHKDFSIFADIRFNVKDKEFQTEYVQKLNDDSPVRELDET